jgi:hypothetical protein
MERVKAEAAIVLLCISISIQKRYGEKEGVATSRSGELA